MKSWVIISESEFIPEKVKARITAGRTTSMRKDEDTNGYLTFHIKEAASTQGMFSRPY